MWKTDQCLCNIILWWPTKYQSTYMKEWTVNGPYEVQYTNVYTCIAICLSYAEDYKNNCVMKN